jgi:hypothetical protein
LYHVPFHRPTPTSPDPTDTSPLSDSKKTRRRPSSPSRPSRNQRNISKTLREKFGHRIPNTVREALILDYENGNTKWADAIQKEIDTLVALNVFKFHPPATEFNRSAGWQRAPLIMIFDVKSQDHRYKARLCVGGHRVDSSDYNTFSSTVSPLTIRLLFLLQSHAKLNLMTADIANAFCTAPVQEKVWAIAGPEFGDRQGCIIEIQRATHVAM